MFIRIVRTTGDAAGREEGVTRWRENIQSRLKEQPGYLGAVILAGLGSGEGSTITYWRDRQSLQATAHLSAELRSRAAELTGRTVTEIDEFELLLAERDKPVTAPAFLRSSDMKVDPGRIDAAVAALRERSLPVLRQHRGFRGLVCAANRETGRTIVSSSWDALEDLRSSDEAIAGIRKEAAEAVGATSVKVEEWEAIFAEMPAEATSAS